jgi:hypothetical protein
MCRTHDAYLSKYGEKWGQPQPTPKNRIELYGYDSTLPVRKSKTLPPRAQEMDFPLVFGRSYRGGV